MRLNRFLNEHYVNITKEEDKRKYVDDLWNYLQAAYAYIGGIKGSGFSSKEDMIKSIPFWKICVRNGKPNAFVLYKDKHGRKMIAGASDGTPEGKKDFKKMFWEDVTLQRGYGEISAAMLKMAQKMFGSELENYLIPADQVEAILNVPIEIVDKYQYKRKIGGEMLTKVMFGKPNVSMPKNL